MHRVNAVTYRRHPRPKPPAPPPARRQPYTALERAVLLTIVYADVFDYPLTRAEVHRRLIAHNADRAAVDSTLEALRGNELAIGDEFVTLAGREAICALRRRRRQAGAVLWPVARRYAGWLGSVPFVRMVAVSGSLAFDNATETGDIDVFCITAPHRLWVARLFIVPLSKLTRLLPRIFPLYLCPNYLLAADALELEDRTLFTAHEVVQAVPLSGMASYREFVAANGWVDYFLPHHEPDDVGPRVEQQPRPLITRWCERLLAGRLGDALDRAVHGGFVAFYRHRAERAGWSWPTLAHAYQRSRYTVPEGGYVRVVRRLFAERIRGRLGWTLAEDELDVLFADGGEGDRLERVYDWDGLFRREYGASGDGLDSSVSSDLLPQTGAS